MRRFIGLVGVLVLTSCTPQEEVSHQTSVNVDLDAVARVFEAVDGLTEDRLDVSGLAAMAQSTKMDEETQQKFPVRFNGEQTELMVHVWREQADWVHLYLATPSEDLIAALKTTVAPFARPEEG